MEQMDLNDIFSAMNFEPIELKKTGKKEDKSKTSSSTTKNKPAKKAEDKLKLDVIVYTGYSEPIILKPCDFENKTEITVKEALTYLCNKLPGYPEGISELQKGKGNVLYLVHKDGYSVQKKTIHLNKKARLILADAEIDLSAVKTAPECDVEISEIENLFKSSFPKYGKTGFIHSYLSGTIVPTFSFPALAGDLDFPVTVGIFGREEIVITQESYSEFLSTLSEVSDVASTEVNEDSEDDSDEEESEDDENETGISGLSSNKANKDIISKIVIEKYPDFGDEHLELQWNKGSKMVIAKMVPKKESAKATGTVEYYPTTALLSLVYTTIQLSPEMFEGKDQIEKEELRKYIEKDRPEFSKERTNISYDKEINLIVMVCTGSRKGIDVLFSKDEMIERTANEYDLFEWLSGSSVYRIEKTKYSCTMADKNNPDKGRYKLLLPKVSLEMYEIAAKVFRQVYEMFDTELMLQLYWDNDNEEYFWHLPVQNVSPDMCDIKREPELEMKHVLIGEFHSHGHHDAYFSREDNRDEKGYRLFGVFGNFHEADADMTVLLRAGTGGCFVNLSLDEVFDSNQAETNIELVEENVGNLLTAVMQRVIIFKV